MVSTKTSDGFSTYVSFILIISNLLRLFWWYCERFSPIILVASIVMITCQLILLYYWVKLKNINEKRHQDQCNSQLVSNATYQPVYQRKQEVEQNGLLNFTNTHITEDLIRNQSVHVGSTMGQETDRFVESFWYWNKFSNYLICLLCIICSVSVLTTVLQNEPIYHMILGSASSGIEACLGIPQLWLNYSRKHTQGLSVVMIGMWLFGDMYRVSYYEQKHSPAQLIICAFFSCLVDCAILTQFYIYRKLTAFETAKA